MSVANSQKGEVSFDVDGTSYTLYLDFNATCLLEDYFSTPQKEVTFDEVMEKAFRGSTRYCRAMIWAALQYHHPTITMQEAGDIVQKSGGLTALSAKLSALAKTATADPEDLRALGVNSKANPQRAQARAKRNAGGNSTSTGVQ